MTNHEIDVLVAEKAMGYPVYSKEEESIVAGEFVTTIYCTKKWNDGETYEDLLPNYSTNISDAWEIIEKVGWGNCMKMWNNQYRAEIVVNNVYQVMDAPTAPMAICLAALKSFGIEIE